MSINKVILSGNITRDPELRSTQTGTKVLAIGFAANNRRRNQSTGAWENEACYIDCFMAGARAEALHKKLSKGQKVAIEGTLKMRQWEKNGEKRVKHEVRIDEIEFLPSGKAQSQDGGAQPQQQTSDDYDSLLDADIDF